MNVADANFQTNALTWLNNRNMISESSPALLETYTATTNKWTNLSNEGGLKNTKMYKAVYNISVHNKRKF
jgi:hypothetical protein